MPLENLEKHDLPQVRIAVVEGEVVATMGPYMGVVEGYDSSGIKIAFSNGQTDYFDFKDIDADMKTLAALPVELRGLMKKDAQGIDYMESRIGFDVQITEIPEAESEGMWDYAVVVTRQSDGQQMSDKVSGGYQVAENYADGMIQRFSAKRTAAEENPERPNRPSDAAMSEGISDLISGYHGGCPKFDRPDVKTVCLHGLSRHSDGTGTLHTAGAKGEDVDEPLTAEEMDGVSKSTDSNDIASEGRLKMRIMADPEKNIVVLNEDGSPKQTLNTESFIQNLITQGVREVVAKRLVEMALQSVGNFVEFVPSEEKAKTGSLEKAAFKVYAVSPPGWESDVEAIKTDKAANPSHYKGEGSSWAIAWAAKNKGYQRHKGKSAAIVTKKHLEENYEDGYIPDEEEGHDEQGQEKEASKQVTGMKYEYIIDLDERGTFQAHVEAEGGGNEIWSVNTDEDPDWFETGYMKHGEDMAGLESYLRQMGSMKPEDELVKGGF